MAQLAKESSSTPKVVVKKRIHAKRAKVFEAWTNPELMQRWFMPTGGSVKVSTDPRVGGKYSADMILVGASACHADPSTNPDEPKHKFHSGEYLEFVPPTKLVFSWSTNAVQNSRVTVDFLEVGEDTDVTITHELLPTEDLREGHTEGWTMLLENLSTVLGYSISRKS